MTKIIDLTGKRFCRLTVIRRALYTEGVRKNKTYWLCQCNCGRTAAILGKNLKQGTTTSCGCYRSELFIKRFHRKPVLIVNFKTGEVR